MMNFPHLGWLGSKGTVNDLTDAKEKLQAWRREYNEIRSHRSLDDLSPLEFKAQWAKTGQKFADDLAQEVEPLRIQGNGQPPR